MELDLLEQINSKVSAITPASFSGASVSSSDQLVAALLFSNILTSPRNDPQLAKAAIHTYNSQQTPQTIYGPNTLGGQYGALLASVSLSVDAVFQTNYKWQLIITGVTNPNPPFQSYDPTVNTFDDVPTAKFYYLKPGANLQINVFNSVSTNTTDGIMSIFPVWNQLTQTQYNVINKYMGATAEY